MKQIEVYGFVGWIGSFILYGLFLLWALIPDEILHSFGIYYYPSKTWALALPSIFCMTLFFLFILYQGVNMLTTKKFNSFYTLQDEQSRFFEKNERSFGDGNSEIHDIPINVVNNVIYYQKEVIEKYGDHHSKD